MNEKATRHISSLELDKRALAQEHGKPYYCYEAGHLMDDLKGVGILIRDTADPDKLCWQRIVWDRPQESYQRRLGRTRRIAGKVLERGQF